MKDKTTLVLTHNEVDGFKPDAYGNGRVVVLKADLDKFKGEDTEKSSFGLYFQTFSLIKRNIVEAIIYLGDVEETSPDWQVKRRAFDAMWRTAIAHVKTADKILVVTCRCGDDLKEEFAEQLKVKLMWSECGGEATLGRLVQERLDEVPKAPSVRKLTLQEEFVTPAQENGWVQALPFRKFAVLGKTLFAGRNDGTIFKKTEKGWDENGFQIACGINEMYVDGDRLLIGDGGCCSGATYWLKENGEHGQIFPVEGQADTHCSGNLKGNVYGFARLGERLFTGVGGCAGKHVYELIDGKWRYAPDDPERYALAMSTASDGYMYLGMSEGTRDDMVCRYDGEKFQHLASMEGRIGDFIEHESALYACATDNGGCHPTSFSNGFVYRITGDKVEKVWEGAGAANEFFIWKGELYTCGRDLAKKGATVVLKHDEGEWRVHATASEQLTIFPFRDILLAGSIRSVDEKNSQAVIYRVTGL